MSDITSVTVNVAIQDTKVTQAGFGTILLVDLHTAFTDRTKSYTSTTEVGVDFPTTSKLYKAAAAIFAQSPSPEAIKIGRIDAGDADISATLDAINLEDNDWYCLGLISQLTADITAAAAWVEANGKIHAVQSEEAAIITSSTADIASVLKAAGYNRTFLMYHHQSGVDSTTGNSISVASEVATVTKIAHGLRVNDPVTISGATDAGADPDVLNGNFVVATVPTADTFTYVATGATDGAATGTITYFARYTFPMYALCGLQLSKEPGTTTWKFKRMAGIAATPRNLMNSSEQAFALGKNANVFVTEGGVNIVKEGTMASGRFIDVQRGTDWLTARISEGVYSLQANAEKIPFTNDGGNLIRNEISPVLDLAASRTVINPLDPDRGVIYELNIPKVSAIPKADRLLRKFTGITFRALVGDAVHGVVVNGTLEV